MPGGHVGAQQQQRGAPGGLPEGGDPLRRLPIGDARVANAGRGENVGIGRRGDILIGAVGGDAPERLLILYRVAPIPAIPAASAAGPNRTWC